MNPASSFDATIPVLTEVFQEEPAAADEASAPALPAPDGAAAELGQHLSARILAQLEGRVGEVLEQRLRASVELAIQAAIVDATADIRASLRQIVADAVDEALAHARQL